MSLAASLLSSQLRTEAATLKLRLSSQGLMLQSHLVQLLVYVRNSSYLKLQQKTPQRQQEMFIIRMKLLASLRS
jgi:hypothetical protein